MKYYSVKKFSDMVGVPYSSLRYFERIGLIKPLQNSENNYRTYTPHDAFLINRFKFFRSLDFEAKEAIYLAELTNQKQLMDQIEHKEDELKKQLLMIQEKLRYIEKYKHNIQLMQKEEDYQIVFTKDKYFLPSSEGHDFTISDYKKNSKWVDLLPITVYFKRIKQSDFIPNIEIKNDYGIAIETENAHYLPKEAFSEKVILIKGGKCVRFCTSKKLYPTIDPIVIINAQKYLNVHKLKIIGDISLEGLTTLNEDMTKAQMVYIPVE